MQSVEPVLENAIKTLQKVVDVRGMAKNEQLEGFIKAIMLVNFEPARYIRLSMTMRTSV